MIHQYTFTKDNGATIFVSGASTLSSAIEKAGLVDAKFTYIRTPIDNDIARPVAPSREYDAAAAHIEALQTELDQMTARVARLEEGLYKSSRTRIHEEGIRIADFILNETAPQSLAAIKADTLEAYGDTYSEGFNSNEEFCGVFIRKDCYKLAAALREGKS